MASPSTKVCFNSNCKEVLGRSRKGWRRRTGEFAELCERCAAAYEEGKFCETFHLSTSGWRCCESCGKQIHCGCIVSFHMFVLLDAGGIECITCARTSFILTPNPAWPPPMLSLPIHHERIIDTSSRKWSPLAGSGPAPWRQSPNLFKESNVQSDMQPKVPFEVKIPSSVDELFMNNRLSGSSLEWKEAENPFGRLKDDSLKVGAPDILENGSAGIKCKEQLNPCVNVSQKPIFLKTDHSSPTVSLHPTSALNGETNDHTKVAGTSPLLTIPAPPAGKRLCNHIGFGSYEEPQICNVKAVGEARGRNQLLPRYWPKLTEQELKQIYGDSNCVITPLFEKMLSASDAGRIGRLVLPKKCAEAYFPPISNPEGMPLRVHDSKGKEWIFQFRFWLNNNSRMYVLEGVTSCIQSLQLQAGDIVTFGRAGSDGKLVMGCRKASVAPSRDQGNKAVDTSNMVTTHGDATRNSKPSEFVSTCPPVKSSILSPDILSVRANSADGVSIFSEVDKSGHPPLELHGQKASHSKRKKLTLGPKAKGLKKETDNGLEQLQLTWTEAQGLLRPPPNVVPSLVVVEGMEIEEYEQDAPIIGRPTIFAKDHGSIQIQWAQCEDCFKWRKVPADALLPPTWTCSGNSWDPERSICSAAQELTSEQLEDLLSTGTNAACKKMKANKKQNTNSSEAVEKGLLSSSSQVNTTTKHPLYRINEAAASPLNEAFKVKFDLNIQPVE